MDEEGAPKQVRVQDFQLLRPCLVFTFMYQQVSETLLVALKGRVAMEGVPVWIKVVRLHNVALQLLDALPPELATMKRRGRDKKIY